MAPEPRVARSHAAGPPSSVYPEREDTYVLVPFARFGAGRSLLDIGTGNGRLVLEAARAGARAVATDRNPEALRHVRATARAEGLRLDVVRTDLAAGLGRFDRVVANPPYLPTDPTEREADRWHNLALDGGPDGCRELARIVDSLADHLTPGAHAFVLGSTLQSPDALERVRAGWVARGGWIRTAVEHRLEGERLFVWELALVDSGP